MVPLLWLRKRLLKGETREIAAVRKGFVPPSAMAHSLLKAAMMVETNVLTRPPCGTSVMAAIRKNS